MDKLISGVVLTPLKVIANPLGDVYHGMKKSDPGFAGFGEAYFSTVNKGDIKSWKKHTSMTLNLVVPVGAIRFVVHDDREGSETKGLFNDFTLSLDNYQRLTVPPGVWMAFQGVGEKNLLLNVANLEHVPEEGARVELGTFPYRW
jgi:dTDP-4-dehydrorhamnose 3,5-epimerase